MYRALFFSGGEGGVPCLLWGRGWGGGNHLVAQEPLLEDDTSLRKSEGGREGVKQEALLEGPSLSNCLPVERFLIGCLSLLP